jgi:hypothetical protein
MKNASQLFALGFDLLAYSSDGNFLIPSFIAIYRKQKIYASFDYKTQKYNIERC